MPKKEKRFEISWDSEGSSYENHDLILRPVIKIGPMVNPGFAIIFRDVLMDAFSETVSKLCKRYFFDDNDSDK